MAGFAYTILGEWQISGPLFVNSQQLHNFAEMMVVICLFEYFHGIAGKIATIIDSQYVYDGITGSAYKWSRKKCISLPKG